MSYATLSGHAVAFRREERSSSRLFQMTRAVNVVRAWFAAPRVDNSFQGSTWAFKQLMLQSQAEIHRGDRKGATILYAKGLSGNNCRK
ncbi:MAG: hypothetical protein ABI939_12150 [Anaerolineaceae bacterium]